MSRQIIHIDADCFFAALEMRDDPTLRNLPIAVGGSPARRGVISTCNYPARRFGVRSAMASAQALTLCPGLRILPHRMEVYQQASMVMRSVFADYTDLIEPLSLDEAFLDVGGLSSGSAAAVATEIRTRIVTELGITVSAGVAPNKFIAKVASDWQKPDGQTVISPAEVDGFVRRLPIARVHGIGRVTAARLRQVGLQTCGDLRELALDELRTLFGSSAERIYDLCRGVDERPVRTYRRRKSLSVEHTYADDLPGEDSCLLQLPELLDELTSRLQRLGPEYEVVKSVVKMKFRDFTSTTVEHAAQVVSLEDYQSLCRQAWLRQLQPVRLLGLGVRFREPEMQVQMTAAGNAAPQQMGLLEWMDLPESALVE